MKKGKKVNSQKKLKKSEFVFIFVSSMLFSFISISLFVSNFSEELNLSPFVLGGGSATKINSPLTEIGGVPRFPPTTPINLDATDGEAQIMVTWDNVPGAEGYKIYRGNTQTTVNEIVGTIPHNLKSWWKDPEPLQGQIYFYAVKAYNAAGESTLSQVNRGTMSSIEGLRYTYDPNGPGFQGTGKKVAIGNNGQETFTTQGSFTNFEDVLLLTTDTHPPTPTIDYVTTISNTQSFFSHVVAAEAAPVYVAMNDVLTIGGLMQPQIRKYSIANSPDWNYTFPTSAFMNGDHQMGVGISDDGTRIVAYAPDGFNTRFVVFDSNTNGIPDKEYLVSFFGGPEVQTPFIISGDGTRAVFRTISQVYILDLSVSSGSSPIVHSEYVLFPYLPSGPITINYDGSRVAYGVSSSSVPGEIRILEEQGGGYVPRDIILMNGVGPRIQRLAMTNNGNLLAGGYDKGFANGFGVMVYDVGIVPANEKMSYEADSAGSNWVKDIVFSEDGGRIAVAMTGDYQEFVGNMGLVDQLQVFRTVQDQNNPIQTIATRGSPFQMDFSPNGKILAAAVKNSNAFDTGYPEEVNVYDIL